MPIIANIDGMLFTYVNKLLKINLSLSDKRKNIKTTKAIIENVLNIAFSCFLKANLSSSSFPPLKLMF